MTNTTHPTEVERLAEVAFADLGTLVPSAPSARRVIVRAVLRAMREPSKGMVNKGEVAVDNGCDQEADSYQSYTIVHSRRIALDTWQAMIDHLLSEGGE